MIKQFYIHKNNAIKLAFSVLLFFSAGMQSVKAQSFVQWTVSGAPNGSGKYESLSGTFPGGTAAATQIGSGSTSALDANPPGYGTVTQLNGATGDAFFRSLGIASSPPNKSLTFTFSTPVIINEFSIADIDFIPGYDDSFSFSGVVFTSATGYGGVNATTTSATAVARTGQYLQYARWTTSTTPVTTFTINYTVTGGVTTAELDYAIKVTAAPAACSLTLATAGTNTQTVNAGTAITPIVYNLGAATGATISPALPAGLIGTYNAGAKTYTISGTPSSSTVYNYTVTATGTGCTGTGTITVNAVTTNICPATTVDLATHTTGVAPTGSTLKWFKAPDLTTPIANPGAVGAGTYYAAYVANDNSCRSPFSAGVVVTIIDCACYNDPKLSPGNELPTKHGITLLKRAGAADTDNWPMVRNGGFTALESNSKGFVITRLTTVEIEGQASPLILPKIANPQEGMMVYDKTAKCLKLYSDGVWSCFNTQTCP